MKLSTAFIIGGYVGLILTFGWWGLAGAALHLGILAVVARQR